MPPSMTGKLDGGEPCVFVAGAAEASSITIEACSPDDRADLQRMADHALGVGFLEATRIAAQSGLVAKTGSKAVGLLVIESAGDVMSLPVIVVDAAYRRRGVGQLLGLAALSRHPDQEWISAAWISGAEIPADRLLRRIGFAPSHRVRDYWLEDSLRRGFTCPLCGHPCRCDAMIYRRHPDASGSR
ncbi:MAG: GNAT family N-acetyltransferase [Betaproteobacteria bacterium]|nr:GNAT family N-acetyltransferase [Betaproteobacteria bacterium]